MVRIGQRIEDNKKYKVSFENISFKLKFQILSIFKTPNAPKSKAKLCFKLIVFLLKIATIIKVFIGISVVTKAPPNPALPCFKPINIEILYDVKTSEAIRTKKKDFISSLNENLKK